ncbi:MAG: purine-nucleoside phosphorylase [Candidatus Omnitrophica bacterium CG11_big_fil_rev_8_21_14_0_20_64_10]|nr:MAG: purine-nucleoside phosphorylase [Candidatus Omnitrophica bacterium CG11_big_fil_rev_8_21_14_0_20_64_10]
MATLWEQVQASVAAIRQKSKTAPAVGVILGTGLGGLGEGIEKGTAIPYGEIPNFPRSTSPGHRGELVLGKLSGKLVAVLEGRFHPYEGYTAEQVTYPVRVLEALGAGTLILSNAAGGLNLEFKAGDLMAIEDHINLMGVNPLVGPNDERFGPRFPDMSAPYDPELIRLAADCAVRMGLPLKKGVYAGVLGPNLETRAEYRFLRGIGADAVGMSTVPEVLAAVHGGMKVFAVSGITDRCDPDHLEPVSIEKILEVAAEITPKMTQLVTELVRAL